jgi:alkylation response protein AidB-like acyl-CoA dehydrogenase
MDFELSEEQRAFQRTAREFAAKALAPHAAQWDASAHFPRETIAQAGELGFCGLYADSAHGGLGLPRLDATLVFEELAAADPSTTAYITIHNMVTWMVTRFARSDVAAYWGPLLASGQKLASYCLTEPDAGSDAASLKTTARREGDFYVLDGGKAFISGAGDTDALVVMARESQPCWCPPTARAFGTARKKPRWVGTASPRASSASTACACPPGICWARKARDSRSL